MNLPHHRAQIFIAVCLASSSAWPLSDTSHKNSQLGGQYPEMKHHASMGNDTGQKVGVENTTVAQLDGRRSANTTSDEISNLQRNTARLQQAIEDMGKKNEDMPLGGPKTGWAVAPLVVMGTNATERSIPKNWPGIRFPEWRAVLPWFVIFEGASGGDNNGAAVEIGGIELWQLSSTTFQWKLLNSSDVPTWVGSYNQDAVGVSKEPAYIAGKRPRSIVAPGINSVVHGGLGQVSLLWNDEKGNADLAALLVAVKHRLTNRAVSPNAVTSGANLVLQAGADYYPRVGTSLKDLGAKYVPGAGLGQMKRVTSEWRYSTLILVDPDVPVDKIKSLPPPDFKY